LKLNSPGF